MAMGGIMRWEMIQIAEVVAAGFEPRQAVGAIVPRNMAITVLRCPR